MTLTPTQREAVERVAGSDVCDAVLIAGRHHIVRVALADGRSVIVKRPRAEDQRRPDGDAGFEREWTALTHLTGCEVVPELLGGDRQATVLVISELPPGRSLADSLLGADANQARADVVAYATALARLNSVPPFPSAPSGHIARLQRGRSVFDLDPIVDAALQVLEAGPRGVVHGDPCPDNVIIDADGVCRIFDFEFATGGSVALDATYLLAPFPSCWCFAPLPQSVADDALAAYRAVLPIDDQTLDAATVAVVVNTLGVVDRIRDEDQPWGLTTMRARLFTWLDACARQRSFPLAAARAERLAHEFREVWGDVSAPPYPAFKEIR